MSRPDRMAHSGGYDFYYALGFRARAEALPASSAEDVRWVQEELLRDPTSSNPNVESLPGMPVSMLSIKRGSIVATFVRVNALVSSIVDIRVIAAE